MASITDSNAPLSLGLTINQWVTIVATHNDRYFIVDMSTGRPIGLGNPLGGIGPDDVAEGLWPYSLARIKAARLTLEGTEAIPKAVRDYAMDAIASDVAGLLEMACDALTKRRDDVAARWALEGFADGVCGRLKNRDACEGEYHAQYRAGWCLGDGG